MKKLILIAAILITSCRLFAQVPPPVRDVTGIVKDASGHNVAGASVILSSKKDALTVTSNADGVFVFADVKRASFKVTVKTTGYKPFIANFKMNDLSKRLVLDPIALKDAE